VTSCANNPKPIKKQVVVSELKPTITADENALSILNKAQQLPTQQAVLQLTLASEKFIQEAQYAKALWLATKTMQLTDNKDNLYRLSLVKAQSLYLLAQYDLALNAINEAHAYANENQIIRWVDDYKTLAKIQLARGLPAKSLIADLHAFSLNEQANEDDIWQLWQHFSQLTPWQQSEIKVASPPYSTGWLKLIKIANQFGDNSARFKRYVITWQQQFPAHPANQIVEKIIQQNEQVTPITIKNIAILLPLTGKQHAAGIAAQQGILAAYQHNKNQQLYFFDTTTLDWEGLPTQFTDLNIDVVIGPLLKQNVHAFINLDTVSIPSLLLNIPDNYLLKAHQFAISMRPEEEAVQAADRLSQKSYQHPVLLSNNDALSHRIAQSFAQQWQKNTTKLPEVYYINSGKQMQKDVQASLDVDSSKKRIAQLKSRLKATIKAESRNRRDTDMIYLVSNAKVTRLLKPYIDVNISPFAKLIPVYASSKSHSAKDELQATRDLAGLTFTEMPLLLTSKAQDKTLAKLNQQLWPQRSDSLHGIFALGFDSLALTEKITLMKNAPYIYHYGQTGTLQLRANNILMRSLLWGKYSHTRVQAIAME
jgi:hypothetical protein